MNVPATKGFGSDLSQMRDEALNLNKTVLEPNFSKNCTLAKSELKIIYLLSQANDKKLCLHLDFGGI